MSDVKITDAILDDEIDCRKKPHRFVVSTNCLIPVKSNGSVFLLLYNVEPEVCETWYPMYSTVDGYYDFNANTYGQLITEFNELRANVAILPDRIKSISNKIIENSSLNSIEIKDNPLFYSEYRVKYSKAQKIWSVYYVEFFLASRINPIENLVNVSNKDFCLVPLDDSSVLNISRSSLYNGIPVVPNVIDILTNKNFLCKLKEASIALEI